MINDIQKVICNYYKIDLLSLKSRCRRKAICYPRSIAIYLCREYTDESLTFIGKAFNRKHPVILHNYEKVKRALAFDNILRNEINFFTQIIPCNGLDKGIVEELEDEYLEIIGEDS